MEARDLLNQIAEEYSEKLQSNEPGVHEEIFTRMLEHGKSSLLKIEFIDDEGRWMKVDNGEVKRKTEATTWEIVTFKNGEMIIRYKPGKYLVAEETAGTKLYLASQPDLWISDRKYLYQKTDIGLFPVSKFSDKDFNLYATKKYVKLQVRFV